MDDFGFALVPDALRVDAERVLGMIQSLGFAANMDETVFEPTTRIELLGFVIVTEAWLYGPSAGSARGHRVRTASHARGGSACCSRERGTRCFRA